MTEQPGQVSDEVIAALEQARVAEKAQALFYRALAASAEERGDTDAAERLNGLLADEQHHLSRISARLLELGSAPGPLTAFLAGAPALNVWEAEARVREREEIARYEALLALPLDSRTRSMIEEFIAAERGHEAELGGKWMEA